jgi:hypothetical protein
MKKLNEIRRKRAQDYVQVVKTGMKIPLFDIDEILFSTKVNLTSNTYINPRDTGYVDFRLPTVADLIRSGEMVCGSYLRRHTVELEHFRAHLDNKTIEKIISQFKENGFSVSRRAIEHNYGNWLCQMDSGYRGVNYHLRTYSDPNYGRIMFEATSLSSFCVDWQQTYPDCRIL